MDLSVISILNINDLLSLPSRTVVHTEDGEIAILIKDSLQHGPHLLVVAAGGSVDRIPLNDFADDQVFTTGQLTAVIQNANA